MRRRLRRSGGGMSGSRTIAIAHATAESNRLGINVHPSGAWPSTIQETESPLRQRWPAWRDVASSRSGRAGGSKDAPTGCEQRPLITTRTPPLSFFAQNGRPCDRRPGCPEIITTGELTQADRALRRGHPASCILHPAPSPPRAARMPLSVRMAPTSTRVTPRPGPLILLLPPA